MIRNVVDFAKHFVNLRLTDVDQHIGVCESLDCAQLQTQIRMRVWSEGLTAKVFFHDLTHCCQSNSIVIKFHPFAFLARLEKRKVVATMQITAVNKNAANT